MIVGQGFRFDEAVNARSCPRLPRHDAVYQDMGMRVGAMMTRCRLHSNSATTVRRLRSCTGSLPSVTGRAKIASWMSGANNSRLEIWVTRARVRPVCRATSARSFMAPLRTIRQVVIFDPPHVTQRIVVQSGCFTAHPPEFVDTPEQWPGHMVKLVVPNGIRGALLDALARLGVHRASLFPDLDGIARHIRQKYSR